MKQTIITASFLLLLIIAGAELLHAKDGRHIGKIESINSGSKEIMINFDGGKPLDMGEQIYVRIGDEVAIMEITFPMMTTSKCRLLRNSVKFNKKIEKGMNVYKFDKSILENKPAVIIEKKEKTADGKNYGDIEMVNLPGGTFMMGSPDSDKDKRKEELQHQVTVSPFSIGKYEITQKQYQAIMGSNPSNFKGDNLPVENITWTEAAEFCKKFSQKYNVKARLPYEAEWEYACRAGTTTRYYWGDEVNGDYFWDDSNSNDLTHAVGEKKPNAFGLHDMSGNVWEWCSDWYDEEYYSKSPGKDPQGAESGIYRILRGGCCFAYSHRSAYRSRLEPTGHSKYYGFRLVIVR